MRHRKFGYTLSRKFNQRKALFLSLVRTVFEYGKVETTQTKANAVRRDVERMAGFAVKGDLVSRREMFKTLQSQAWVNNICEVMMREFAGRNDNFTTIKLIKRRQGDDSVIVKLSLVKDLKFSKEKLKAEVVKPVSDKAETKKEAVKVTTRVAKKAPVKKSTK